MIQTIGQNIYSFFDMYARRGSKIAIIVFAAAFIAGGCYTKRRGCGHFLNYRILIKSVAAAGLAMYVYIVIGITLLSRSEAYSAVVNLRLFSTFGSDFWSHMFIYENILLFVPLGILLFLLAKPFRKAAVSLFTGAACSLVIETIQFLTHLGRFELDDILTNTIGMLIGFLLCRCLILVFRRLKQLIFMLFDYIIKM